MLWTAVWPASGRTEYTPLCLPAEAGEFAAVNRNPDKQPMEGSRTAPDPSVASFLLFEGVVEAHPEQIHGEAVVDVIQREIAIFGANTRRRTRRYPGGGAGHARVAPLAEVHVVVFRSDRPRSAEIVVKPGADIPAAGLEVLAAGDAGRCSR